MSGTGRFIRVDKCIVDKARLDFAPILILTPILEIVNMSTEFLIDNDKYVIKSVEEWGCSLGEDAFLMEQVVDSSPEMLSQPNDDVDLEEVQGERELDELVEDLHKELCKHEDNSYEGKRVDTTPMHCKGIQKVLVKQHQSARAVS